MSESGDTAGRVLLICPRFFDYQLRIAGVLHRLGYETVVLDDRPSSHSLYKAALRLAPGLTARLTHRITMRHLAEVEGQHFDHVLVVKGEAITRRAIGALRQWFPQARFSLYLWDAVRNNRNSKDAAPLYDAAATFDPADAARYGWGYRPLFADASVRDDNEEKIYDWSFIGTLHSDRMAVLARLKRSLGDRPFFLFGFYSSSMLAAFGKLKNMIYGHGSFGTVSTKALAATAVRQIVSQSRSIVDIEHPQQVGLTTRTIETLMAGRKLITTNTTVRQSALYDGTRICVIDRFKPEVPADFFDLPFTPLSEAARYGYSDLCWARRVLGLPDTKISEI
ncbi:hypothetical protein [Rhizobium sp. AG855]|uniref:hypothetical protein n=1 Tax=Rhizobium sp. AG855 TaxID=2183898 RepID=UPI000E726549|nr:hypothetical protein [Rhizobium sp. AG855]RKE85555.1 hypothetical protein DFO46_2356 [Rhizobium sp. AG855]